MTKNANSMALAAIFLLLATACGTQRRRIEHLHSDHVSATLALSRGEIQEERRVIESVRKDTLTVRDDDGRELLIMKAVRDEGSGEMVAHDEISAAVITARFRNVAERHGRIDLRFEIIVPADMQDSKWQLRFHPDMFIMGDSLRLESVYITGQDYRKGQLRGYEQYERFVRSIITDTTRFVDIRNLELFLKRNLPEVYYFKNDTSFVSDETFASYYGVTERDAVEHYTNWVLYRFNEKKKGRKDLMFRKYVKAPIETEGIRLDTVMRTSDGDFVYQYTQTIRTRPKLRKVDIVLGGDIYESDRKLFSMDRTEPLTFYVSSMSTLLDPSEKYISRIVERRAAANTACYVEFAQGSFEVNPSLGYNRDELSRIRGNIFDVLGNETFDIDSIVISASASPEGSLSSNNVLSARRAAAVADYFDRDIRRYRDSLRRNSFGIYLDADGNERVRGADIPEIRFRSRSSGENWPYFTILVDQDSLLTGADKRSFMKHLEVQDVDAREDALRKEPYYRYMREVIYPRLRTVRFDFFLHRKGMVRDTVHTTELDTTYMKGVDYLRERDYAKAIEYLRDYRDYNAAIAYISMDYNASAMAILRELERTPPVSYMLAVLYARSGSDEAAVQCYLDACRKDHSYVFRGNLDPEIYVLIKRYGLNQEENFQ